MFKSADKLRHEAAQRQLDRVASSWRNARTTWFDGTPQSIEARLAETNRILTVARSGYSPAHLGLTVEAENARRELMAARHRLLVDFLDSGARVAGYHDVDPEAPWRNTMADEPYASLQDTPEFGDLPVDGNYSGRHRLRDNDHRKLKSHRTAGWPNDDERYDDSGEYIGAPWPQDLAHHLTSGSPHAGYDAGFDASWHPDFLDSQDPWGDAGEAWHAAGGPSAGFDDGWVDSASDIPHKYNDPEGYAAHHADMGKRASRRTAGLGLAWEGKACSDCAMAIANGDDSGNSEEWSWDKMEHGISGLPGDKHPIIDCSDCEDGSHGFSRGPCDLCGSPYDGEFHRVVTLGHDDGQ